MTAPEPNGLPAANARVIPPASVSVILGVITVYAGHVVEDTPVTESVVIGGGFLILGLSVMHYVSPGFSDVFALLILVAITLRYGVGILQGIGLAGNNGTT
jgi:hypothetical protein